MDIEKSLAKIASTHDERRAILADIEDNGGVISEIVERKMTQLDVAIPEQFDELSDIMDHLQGGAEYCRAQAKKWSDKAHQLEDNYSFINEKMKAWMSTTEQKYVFGKETKFNCYEMKPRMVIGDENNMPAKYFDEKVVYVLNKERVREDVEAGEFVPTVRMEKVLALRRSVNIPELPKAIKAPKKPKTKELTETIGEKL